MKLYSILLISLLLLTACSEQMSIEQITEKVIEAGNNVRTYSVDMNMQMDMQMALLGQDVTANSEMITLGVVDRNVRKAHMQTSMTTEMPTMTNTVETEIYITDNTAYTKTMNMWMKMPVHSDMWDQQDQFEQILGLISAGTLEQLPDETLNGKRYYVAKITTDPAQLLDFLAQNDQDLSLEDNTKLEEIMKSYSTTIWVNKKTFVAERTIIEMNMDMSEDENTVKIDAVIDMTLSDINKPVVIEIPEEALEGMNIGAVEDAAMKMDNSITGNVVNSVMN